MKSRNVIVVAVVAFLLASVAWSQVAGATSKHHVRKASGTYDSPAVGLAGNGGGQCSQSDGLGCVQFSTTVSERVARLSVTDASGQPVYATWGQDLNGDGISDVGSGFCGKTATAVSIHGGVALIVFIWEGPGADVPCAGVATQGSVTAKFSS